MATLLELKNAGQVIKVDPQLDPREQEDRLFYILPRLEEWFTMTLPDLESTWNIEITPLEQVYALIADFCTGKTLTYGEQFKEMTHIRDGIWELKTADIRIFGRFCKMDCFVGANAGLTRDIKGSSLYTNICIEAANRLDQLDLDEPKFISGKDPRNVVSAFDFS
jgi:hypothetical protein